MAQRQEVKAETDRVLDAVGQSVVRLQGHAAALNGELEEQKVLTDDLGDSLDGTEGTLGVVTKKTQTLLDRSGRCCWPWGLIAFLAVASIILLVLLIFG